MCDDGNDIKGFSYLIPSRLECVNDISCSAERDKPFYSKPKNAQMLYYYFNEILKKECRRDHAVPFLSLLNLFPRNMPKGSRQTTRYRFKPKTDECLANLSMHCPSFIHGSWWQPIVIKVLNPRAKSWSPAEDERITYIEGAYNIWPCERSPVC